MSSLDDVMYMFNQTKEILLDKTFKDVGGFNVKGFRGLMMRTEHSEIEIVTDSKMKGAADFYYFNVLRLNS